VDPAETGRHGDGTTQWTVEPGPPVVGQPTVTDGTLYVPVVENDSEVTLRALEPQ